MKRTISKKGFISKNPKKSKSKKNKKVLKGGMNYEYFIKDRRKRCNDELCDLKVKKELKQNLLFINRQLEINSKNLFVELIDYKTDSREKKNKSDKALFNTFGSLKNYLFISLRDSNNPLESNCYSTITFDFMIPKTIHILCRTHPEHEGKQYNKFLIAVFVNIGNMFTNEEQNITTLHSNAKNSVSAWLLIGYYDSRVIYYDGQDIEMEEFKMCIRKEMETDIYTGQKLEITVGKGILGQIKSQKFELHPNQIRKLIMGNFVSKKWNLEIQVDFTPKNIKRAKNIINDFAKPMTPSVTTAESKIKQTAKILIGKTEEQEKMLEASFGTVDPFESDTEQEDFGGFEAVEQEQNTKIISECEELSGDNVDPNLNEVKITEEDFGDFGDFGGFGDLKGEISDDEYGFDL